MTSQKQTNDNSPKGFSGLASMLSNVDDVTTSTEIKKPEVLNEEIINDSPKGFSGLVSMVSDVKSMTESQKPEPLEKKAAVDTNKPIVSIPSQQTSKNSSKTKNWIIVLGIIFGLIWLVSEFNNKSTTLLAKYEITTDNGSIYNIETTDDATEQEISDYFNNEYLPSLSESPKQLLETPVEQTLEQPVAEQSEVSFTDKAYQSAKEAAQSFMDSPFESVRKRANDQSLAITKGFIGIPEFITGIADIACGGEVGKYLEDKGIDFQAAKDYLSSRQSPEEQAASKEREENPTFGGTVESMALNSTSTINAALESLPSSYVGGRIEKTKAEPTRTIFTFAAPNGKEYDIEAPEGSTQEEALDYLVSNWDTLKDMPSANDAEKVNKSTKSSRKIKTIATDSADLLSDAKAMVISMIDYALIDGGLKNESEIQKTQKRITALPKPIKTNIKEARDFNNNGLALVKKENYDDAVKLFENGNKLNPADIEIVNNLGFAYVKQNQLDSAQQAMITSLAMAPNRAIAWANLGDVYALKNDKSRAVACLANAYRFSRNREKTHQFFKSLNEKENVEQLKQARNEAISWAEKTYFVKQSTFESSTTEITDKKDSATNQRKQSSQDDYMQSESVTEKAASYSPQQTVRNNEQSSVDIANFKTCISGQYVSLCKHDLLTNEQAIQVDAAEKRANFNTCITGQYPYSCKHNLLTNEQAIQVDAAEKRDNLKTCITGQYPYSCKHNLLTNEQAIQVHEAERRAR